MGRVPSCRVLHLDLRPEHGADGVLCKMPAVFLAIASGPGQSSHPICSPARFSVQTKRMRKRTRYSLLIALALVAALIAAIWLRKHAPPEVARLLPESDAIVYVNLKPIRLATHFDHTPIARSQDYQRFIDATGIDPERDLDAVAFALHRMDNPNGPNGPVAYSEVFEGRFDGARLSSYLSSIASAHEDYAGHTIYTIPIEGRQLRVVQLGYDTIAASNMPTTEQIHAMLDRYRAAASPFSGASLLEARYKDVPLLATAWGIGHIGLPFSESGRIRVFGIDLPLPEDTTFVASLRPSVSSIHLRIEQIAPSDADAAASAAALSSIVGVAQTIQPLVAAQSSPADAKALGAFASSIKVEQHKDRAVLTANLPLDLVKSLTAGMGPSAASPAMAENSANEDPIDRRLTECLLPKAQYGKYSSFDGGKSAAELLQKGCPEEYLAWVKACEARGDTNRDCVTKVTIAAQSAIKQFGK